MYSLSAFFILSSRAPPSTSAVAFITPPRKHLDIIKTLDHRKYIIEVNRSFIMNEGSPSGFLSWLDLMRVYPWNCHLRRLNDATLFNRLVVGVILSLQLLNPGHQ